MEEQPLVSVWNRLLTWMEPVSHVQISKIQPGVFLVESGSHRSSFNKSEVGRETSQWSDYASELNRSFQILMQSIPQRDEELLSCKLPSGTTGLTTTPRFSSSLWTALSNTENWTESWQPRCDGSIGVSMDIWTFLFEHMPFWSVLEGASRSE